MIKIAGGHAVEAFHPAVPPTVIRVDILADETGVSYANTLSEVDRIVDYTAMLGITPVDRCTIGTQHGFPFEMMTDRVVYGSIIDCLHRVGQRMTFPVAHDQHSDFVTRIAAFAGVFIPLPRRRDGRLSDSEPLYDRRMNASSASAIPDRHGACIADGTVRNRWYQRNAVLRWPTRHGHGPANALAVNQGPGKQPSNVTMAQPRKRRTGQRVEYATTRVTFVALQATGMAKAHRRTRCTLGTIRYAERVRFTGQACRRIRACHSSHKPLLLCSAQRRKIR